MKSLLRNKLFIAGTLLSSLFIALCVLVSCNVTQDFDQAIIQLIYELRGSTSAPQGFFYWINRILTEAGYVFVLVPSCVIAIIVCKCDLKSLFLSLGTLIVWLTNKLIKIIFVRQRPPQIYHMMTETSASFPSGHAMSSAFFYFFLSYIIYNLNISKKIKAPLFTACIIMPFIIALTRINLSVHYLTDVIAGILFSGAVVCFAIITYQHFFNKGYNGLKTLLTKKK